MSDLDVLPELHRLRDNVDATGSDVDALTLLRARRRLLERAVGAQVAARRHHRRWPRVVVAASVAGAVAAGIGVGQVTGLFAQTATPAAAAALNQAADITLTVKDPVVGANQYLKITETRRGLNVWYEKPNQVSARFFSIYTTTRWIPGDPARQSVIANDCGPEPGPADFLDAKSAAYVAARDAKFGPMPCPRDVRRGVGPSFGDAGVTSPWMAPTSPFLASLPRDPRALFDRIHEGAAAVDTNTVEDQMMGRVTDLLRTGLVPADLRAALFRAAALIPGVDVVSDAVTLDGHTGVAIAYTAGQATVRNDLIFDPRSGQVIGQRTVLLQADGDTPAGTVTGTSYQTEQVVDTAP